MYSQECFSLLIALNLVASVRSLNVEGIGNNSTAFTRLSALSSGLQGGGVVTVDPDTQRASVTRDGVTSPLWNGVQRLQDGSVMIVNHGEAVPGEPVANPNHGEVVPGEPVANPYYQLQAPEETDWEGALIAGYSPCEQLTHHVCGLHNECATAKACNPSRQLLAMEQEERAKEADSSRMTYTSGQCINAKKDVEYFSACRPGK